MSRAPGQVVSLSVGSGPSVLLVAIPRNIACTIPNLLPGSLGRGVLGDLPTLAQEDLHVNNELLANLGLCWRLVWHVANLSV